MCKNLRDLTKEFKTFPSIWGGKMGSRERKQISEGNRQKLSVKCRMQVEFKGRDVSWDSEGQGRLHSGEY
jgi:hypothetical protein